MNIDTGASSPTVSTGTLSWTAVSGLLVVGAHTCCPIPLHDAAVCVRSHTCCVSPFMTELWKIVLLLGRGLQSKGCRVTMASRYTGVNGFQ